MKNILKKESVIEFLKVMFTVAVMLLTGAVVFVGLLSLVFDEISLIRYLSFYLIPVIFLPPLWCKHRKRWILISLSILLLVVLTWGIDYGVTRYQKSLVIDTSPNINTDEYLPFAEDTKIVKIENSSLKLTHDLPIIDGAAAVFPVYSSFVNAVYPTDTVLDEFMETNSPFKYNNTTLGYQLLAEKKIDIFFGAYPSKNQITYANENNTEFEYIQIGSEAFVFFVHKNNPINNLTTNQIKDIYSGKITNWKEVGGKDEEIVAYQRNNGSGSQSMLIRFMGSTPIMDAPTEQINDMMSGIINRVADYRSKPASIGFSFRYYVEGIIQNPDIKVISIDGVAPTVENIKNGTYAITTPLYAVTYKNNPNKNVQTLLDWILSDEGQMIIEKTGYVGVQ